MKSKALIVYFRQLEASLLKVLIQLCRAHDMYFIGTNINVKKYWKITTVGGGSGQVAGRNLNIYI